METFRCQATEALRATEPLHPLDLRQYVRELTSGNVELPRFLRVAVHGVTRLIVRRLRLRGIARRLGVRRFQQPEKPATRPPRERLDLQLGELVEVRAHADIERDLDASGRSRGLWYDIDEMGPFSGGQYRVKDRVERIIDERTGKMIEIASDCLILDDVMCSGDRSNCRYFCPRGIYPYWREGWLRRVEEDHADT